MRHSESYLNQCFGRDKFRRGRIWVVFHSTTLGRYRLTLDETSSVLSFAISLFGCLSKRATAEPQYYRHGDKDRYPFPVPLRVYDQTIQVLKSASRKQNWGERKSSRAPTA